VQIVARRKNNTVPDPVEIRAFQAQDAAAIDELLVANELPPDGMDTLRDTTVVARIDERIVGCAALELYDNAALLRSVAVHADVRDRGLGRRLVHEMLARARGAGVRELYLLTLTAERWFPRFGFEVIRRDQAPETIRRSDEFTTLCPDAAVLMRLPLS
jgi:amino-acid N-acetyltransferase